MTGLDDVTGTVLVDSCVLLDVLLDDPRWADWSAGMLERVGERAVLAVNPVIYAEVSVGFDRIEDLEDAVPRQWVARLSIPWEAAFLAGKCFLKYRSAGGSRSAPLPDFFIGAHAAVESMPLLTRDTRRYATYFPTVKLIAPA
jgi:predicted nucleic acid-binding protein